MQKYIVMHFKHPHGAPCPYCILCGCETWSYSHIFSNKHLDKLLNVPYRWQNQWHEAPTYTETGIDDPQSGDEGITFPVIHSEYVKHWPVKVRMPAYKEGPDAPHFELVKERPDAPQKDQNPHVRLVEEQHGTQWDWDANGNKVAQPMAEQPAYVAHPRVTFEPDLPPISTLPPCRAQIPAAFSLDNEQLESFLASMHSLCRRLKKRVGLLEQESVEDIEKF